MKIIQFQAMENNEWWQGCVLGLGDDGVLYILEDVKKGWSVYVKPKGSFEFEDN